MDYSGCNIIGAIASGHTTEKTIPVAWKCGHERNRNELKYPPRKYHQDLICRPGPGFFKKDYTNIFRDIFIRFFLFLTRRPEER